MPLSTFFRLVSSSASLSLLSHCLCHAPLMSHPYYLERRGTRDIGELTPLTGQSTSLWVCFGNTIFVGVILCAKMMLGVCVCVWPRASSVFTHTVWLTTIICLSLYLDISASVVSRRPFIGVCVCVDVCVFGIYREEQRRGTESVIVWISARS